MTTEPTVAHMPLKENESEWVIDGLRSEIREAEATQARRAADGVDSSATRRYIDEVTRLLGHLRAAHRAAFHPDRVVVDAQVLPSASEVATAFEAAYEELRSLLPDGVKVSSDRLSQARTLIGYHVAAELHADLEARRALRPEDQPAGSRPLDPEVTTQLEELARLIGAAHAQVHANRGAFLAGYEQGQLTARADADHRRRAREEAARRAFARSEFVPPAEPEEPGPFDRAGRAYLAAAPEPAPTYDRETRARITGQPVEPEPTGYVDAAVTTVRSEAAEGIKGALTELRRRGLPFVLHQCGAYDTTGCAPERSRRCVLEAGHDDPAEGVGTDRHEFGS